MDRLEIELKCVKGTLETLLNYSFYNRKGTVHHTKVIFQNSSCSLQHSAWHSNKMSPPKCTKTNKTLHTGLKSSHSSITLAKVVTKQTHLQLHKTPTTYHYALSFVNIIFLNKMTALYCLEFIVV